MNAFYLGLLGSLLAPLTAGAAEFAVSTEILYYTDNDARKTKLSTELLEEGGGFRFERDAYALAREMAVEELRLGNVCLQQVKRDLRESTQSGRIESICEKVFDRELAASERKKGTRVTPVCTASAEAFDEKGRMRLFVVFQLGAPKREIRQTRVLASLGRGDFREPGLEWMEHETPLGPSAESWKGLLKNGSCSLGKERLAEVEERFLSNLQVKRQLVACNRKNARLADHLARIQAQFRQYVPDEWVQDFNKGKVNPLLKEPAAAAPFTSLTDCVAARNAASQQLEELMEVTREMADRYDIPALSPEAGPYGRKLASDLGK